MKFKSYEKKLINQFLDDLSERYGNSGCNDFVLKWMDKKNHLTQEEIAELNQDYWRYINEHCERLDVNEELDETNTFFTDFMLVEMIKKRLLSE